MIAVGVLTAIALVDVRAERERQERLGLNKAAQGIRWASCADTEMDGGDDRRYVVLGEEFGEVARALLEGEGDAHLRAELVQVAAVAVAWIEAIDARDLATGSPPLPDNRTDVPLTVYPEPPGVTARRVVDRP
jgi:hypothetical protein